MNKTALASMLALALFAAPAAHAAKINVINLDTPGVGLNDTAPAMPVGGNPGTTRGQQAQIVYQFAADLWGGVLESGQDINVYASFRRLNCTASGGTLAQAGANDVWLLNFGDRYRAVGAPLAEALLDQNLSDPSDPGDITTSFNGAMGQADCLAGLSWYFGLDGKTPDNQVNFLNVVMHEIGHGLGGQSFITTTTGAFPNVPGLGPVSDLYAYNAYDNVANVSFEQSTNAQRLAALTTPGRTVWTGAAANYTASLLLDGGYQETALIVTAPESVAKAYAFQPAAFGPAATTANFSGEWVAAIDAADAAGPLTSDGCSAITNDVTGKIAMIERGTCGFTVKAKNAQDAGATGVVIVNSAAGAWGSLGGADPTVVIPTIMVQRTDGLALIAAAPVTGGMALGPVTLAGTDTEGRTRLYTPRTVAPGSTFSHFDTVLNPNALMEPFDTPEVQAHVNVDLTAGLFWDIFWNLNPGNGKLATSGSYSCDTGVDAVEDGGFILGANLQANHMMCANNTTTPSKYVQCMTTQAKSLQTAGLLSGTEVQKVIACARKVMSHLP